MLQRLFAQGPLAYAIVAFGLAATATGVLALATSRSRSGLPLGLISLVLTLGCTTSALVTVIAGRARVDRAAAEAFGVERERIRERGYAATRAAAEAGFGFGFAALLLGGAGTTMSMLRRRKEDPEGGELGATLGTIVLGGVAVFSVVATGMPLLMGIPGGALAADDPAQGFATAEGHFAEGRASEGCADLDGAFRAGANPAKARVRSVDALVSECFEQRLSQALAATSLEDRNAALAWLTSSKLPLTEEQRRRLDQESKRSLEMAADPGGPPDATSSSPLPETK